MWSPASARTSRKAVAPRPVSMIIVTPVVRGRRILRFTITSRDHTPCQPDLKPVDVTRQLPQHPFDHRQVRSPRDNHDFAFTFDVECPKTAFEYCRLAPAAGDHARAHFHSRRLIAIEVAVELQAALAADQGPVASGGGALGEVVDRGAEVAEASRSAGDQEGR